MKKDALVDNVLPPLVYISMLMALAAALLYAPTEKVMGDTQRISISTCRQPFPLSSAFSRLSW